MSLTSSPSKGSLLGLQPTPAWTAILLLVLVTAAGAVPGVGKIVRLIFPAGAFAVGGFLYLRYPILYLGFTWWLWFLTPWVRRLIDLKSGWAEPNPVLLAPFLATFFTLITFLRHLPKSYRQGSLPFVLSFTGVFYAALLGFVNGKYGFHQSVLDQGETSLTTAPTVLILRTLEWAIPILCGFHLYVNWPNYLEYRRNILRTFRWGVLVMGVYGIVQYTIAPEWDRFWLMNMMKNGFGFGLPEPFGMRVFSTMNSAGPFAHAMMAGLLLLLADQGIIRFLAAGPGYLSLLLTLVRAAWGGWLLAFLVFSNSLKAKLQMRLIITILVIGIIAFPFTTVEPIATVVNSRLQTFSNVEEDVSYQARTAAYNWAWKVVPFQFLGNGFGLPGRDSALIDVALAMGWLGGIPYLSGFLILLFKVLQNLKIRFDPFLSATSAIVIGSVGMLVLNNVFTGVQGVILWSFLGISAAGHKYYQYQSISGSKRG